MVVVVGTGVQFGIDVHVSVWPTAVQAEQIAVLVVISVIVVTTTVLVGSAVYAQLLGGEATVLVSGAKVDPEQTQ
mgnify:CR=1 FL=1